MGWKGTFRTIRSAVREAERENQRYLKQEAKIQKLEKASITVKNYEAYLNRISRFHTGHVAQKIDWLMIANQSPPSKPIESFEHETVAKFKHMRFRPSIFDKIFKRINKKQNILQQNVLYAMQKDEEECQKKQIAYLESYKKWENEITLAKKLL